MVVGEPASMKIALLSERVRPPLVIVVKPVSVPSVFSVWSALVVAVPVADDAALSILRFEANEEAIGGTTSLSIARNTSGLSSTTSSPAALAIPVADVAALSILRSEAND